MKNTYTSGGHFLVLSHMFFNFTPILQVRGLKGVKKGRRSGIPGLRAGNAAVPEGSAFKSSTLTN